MIALVRVIKKRVAEKELSEWWEASSWRSAFNAGQESRSNRDEGSKSRYRTGASLYGVRFVRPIDLARLHLAASPSSSSYIGDGACLHTKDQDLITETSCNDMCDREPGLKDPQGDDSGAGSIRESWKGELREKRRHWSERAATGACCIKCINCINKITTQTFRSVL